MALASLQLSRLGWLRDMSQTNCLDNVIEQLAPENREAATAALFITGSHGAFVLYL